MSNTIAVPNAVAEYTVVLVNKDGERITRTTTKPWKTDMYPTLKEGHYTAHPSLSKPGHCWAFFPKDKSTTKAEPSVAEERVTKMELALVDKKVSRAQLIEMFCQHHINTPKRNEA
jgi:hypothetical protein